MLQTIREYALERFEESGEAEHIRRHHANFFLELAEQAELGLQEVDQVERLEQLEDEHGNMRAALRWSVESGEAEMGLRLAGALSQFWAARGYYTEGQEWLVGGLSKAKAKAKVAGHRDTSDVGVREGMLARAKALFGAANLAYYLQNDETSAHTLAEESLVMFRKLGDKQGIANS